MRRKINRMLSFGLALIMMFSIAGCGSNAQPQAEIDPDTPVSEVQFPLKETEELSFITSAPATSTQDPNERIIFQRLEEQTNVHIKWTCFVSDQFSDKKNLLELYNAVSGRNYDNADDLQIVTLENAVYMGMKNDLAFLLNTGIYLYEHQSTVNTEGASAEFHSVL